MMKQTLKASGLYPPVFEETQEENKQCVLVKLSNEAKLSEWDMAEDYLQNHDTIQNKDLREILNLSKRDSPKASKLLKGWVESGFLEIANPSEGTRNRKYCLKRKSDTASLSDSLTKMFDRLGKSHQDLLSKLYVDVVYTSEPKKDD